MSLSSENLVSKFAFKWVNLCRSTVAALLHPGTLLVADDAPLNEDALVRAGSSLPGDVRLLTWAIPAVINWALPGGVRLVTWTIAAVINWCF